MGERPTVIPVVCDQAIQPDEESAFKGWMRRKLQEARSEQGRGREEVGGSLSGDLPPQRPGPYQPLVM